MFNRINFSLMVFVLLISNHPLLSASNIAGLSGSYVCLSNKNFAPFSSFRQGMSDVGANNLGIWNFDNFQSSSIVSLTASWGQSNVTERDGTLSGSFTITLGPISGSYTANFLVAINGDSTNTTTYAVNFIPGNGGNTLFISSSTANTKKEPETGICQKQ